MKPDEPDVIAASEVIYRRAPRIPHPQWTVVDQGTKAMYVTLAALKWDEDGISCYRKGILVDHDLEWPAVKRSPEHGVFSLLVSNVRHHGLGAAFDPWPPEDEPHPSDVAHSLIVDCGMPSKETKSARTKLGRTAVIVHTGSPSEPGIVDGPV
ncbi:hypothetical protein ABIA30_003111 [Mycobacterium sp. MAA66]|uniref:hypothetical protein n=1 Tax=Mycobacterium sp. MAA66 TaxID=3156297 RepID=UPI003514C5EA